MIPSGTAQYRHVNPDEGLSDGPNMIPLDWVEGLLKTCLKLRAVVQAADESLIGKAEILPV